MSEKTNDNNEIIDLKLMKFQVQTIIGWAMTISGVDKIRDFEFEIAKILAKTINVDLKINLHDEIFIRDDEIVVNNSDFYFLQNGDDPL